MSSAAELNHLFRALKAPAAARALPKLAARARAEEWSYERFAEVLLATEVATRETHGGESRIKAARFPARKTLEEFDFSFQRSVRKTVIEGIAARFGYPLSKVELRLYVGKFAGKSGDEHSGASPTC